MQKMKAIERENVNRYFYPDRSRLEPTSSTFSHSCSSLTNNSWITKWKSLDNNHARDISNSVTCSFIWNCRLPSKLIPTHNGSIQTEKCYSLGRNFTEESKDSCYQSPKTFPLESLLPLKKRSYFDGIRETEKSEQNSQMKHLQFKLESDDHQQGSRSHGKHKAEKGNSLEILTLSKPSLIDIIEEPLDLSLKKVQTNEDENDHATLIGSVRSDVEINDEQVQQEDSLCHQFSVEQQQELSEYPLLDDSNQEIEMHTTYDDLPNIKLNELEELESSIAIDSIPINRPLHHSEPDLKSGKLQGYDTEELESTSVDNVPEKPLLDEKINDSLQKGIDGAEEEKEKCDVEKRQSETEKSTTEYMVEEETLQPVLRDRSLGRKKSKITVTCRLSFTRMPREDQMRIDPERAMKLREENNRACKKNRLKRVRKMMELEEELTRLKEIARQSNIEEIY